jgi:glucosamine kinase
MILIADSGSTKTDWRLISHTGRITQARTIGLNPYYQNTNSIINELEVHIQPLVDEEISDIYFYGTGCAGEQALSTVRNALLHVFERLEGVLVASDMLGAARAACGRAEGIACILGTGSNNCLYDGHDIIDQIPSLGFWLGDEGSGGYLGKTIVVKYLHRELPEDLYQKFENRYAINRIDVLENAYKKPFPNRYFADFSKFMFDNRSHPYIYQELYHTFSLFFDKYVLKHSRSLPVSLVGSIAFYYSDIIRRVAADKNISIKNIIETPIAGLTLYHAS